MFSVTSSAAHMAGSRNQTGNAEHGISCKTRHLYLAETRHSHIALTNFWVVTNGMVPPAREYARPAVLILDWRPSWMT
jgi:hypothetical protein